MQHLLSNNIEYFLNDKEKRYDIVYFIRSHKIIIGEKIYTIKLIEKDKLVINELGFLDDYIISIDSSGGCKFLNFDEPIESIKLEKITNLKKVNFEKTKSIVTDDVSITDIKFLNKGTYNEVYEVIYNGKLAALRKNYFDIDPLQYLPKQIKNYVPKIYDILLNGDRCMYVMELLYDFKFEEKHIYQADNILEIFKKNNIAHRDLFERNIMMNEERNLIIIDFSENFDFYNCLNIYDPIKSEDTKKRFSYLNECYCLYGSLFYFAFEDFFKLYSSIFGIMLNFDNVRKEIALEMINRFHKKFLGKRLTPKQKKFIYKFYNEHKHKTKYFDYFLSLESHELFSYFYSNMYYENYSLDQITEKFIELTFLNDKFLNSIDDYYSKIKGRGVSRLLRLFKLRFEKVNEDLKKEKYVKYQEEG